MNQGETSWVEVSAVYGLITRGIIGRNTDKGVYVLLEPESNKLNDFSAVISRAQRLKQIQVIIKFVRSFNYRLVDDEDFICTCL